MSKSCEPELHLTSREQFLIKNFRAMEQVGQDILVDVSEEFAEAFPAAPRRLAQDGATGGAQQ